MHKAKCIVLIASTSALLLAFQNCSKFGAGAYFGSSESASTDSTSKQPIDNEPIEILHQIKGREMVPIEIGLDTIETDLALDPAQLPAGASFDAASRVLLWLPTKGQAGSYEFLLPAPTPRKSHRLTLTIDPVPETEMHAGPGDYFKDGDVGYVFVHGAGEVDRCQDRADLAAYWGASVDLLAPDTNHRLVACYDSRLEVAMTAPGVAQQILGASCGRFNKCIIITHSMGGLMLEHMMTHTREPRPDDPEPEMFASRELYQRVKDKTLFVISLGSAAGGSKVANILENPDAYGVGQATVAYLAPLTGRGSSGSTRNLQVPYATGVVAPIDADPGVPFFMVPGYSPKLLSDSTGFIGGLFEQLIGTDEAFRTFNGDASLAFLDRIALFKSRSDGLVDFRSSCGVRSREENEGPGHSTDLARHFEYCAQAPKKANHYVWFATNMNHFVMLLPWQGCGDDRNPCSHHFSNGTTLVENSDYRKLSAMQVIRDRLTANRSAIQVTRLRLNPQGDPPSPMIARAD